MNKLVKVLINYYKFGILFSAILILAIEVGWIPSSGLPVRDIVYYMKLVPMTLVIAISFILFLPTRFVLALLRDKVQEQEFLLSCFAKKIYVQCQ